MIRLSKQQFQVCKALIETHYDPHRIAQRLGIRYATIRMHIDHAKNAIAAQKDYFPDNIVGLVLTLIKYGFTDGREQVQPLTLLDGSDDTEM